MKDYYCWRCDQILPFLDEEEWAQMGFLEKSPIQRIFDYRNQHKCSLQQAQEIITTQLSARFKELTGKDHFHFNVIYHHRLSLYGAECSQCGHLLRTPKASYCAHCGQKSCKLG